MRNIVFIFGLLCFPLSVEAQIQQEGELFLGLKGGYLTSTLKGIENSVLPIEYRPIERQYSNEYWLRNFSDGFSIDGFIHYRPDWDKWPLTWQLEFSYIRLGGGLSMMTDSLSGSVPFDVYNEYVYDYLNAGLVLNFHPGLIGVDSDDNGNFFSGFHISAGILGGVPVPGREQVRYTSTDPLEPPYKIKNVEKVLADHFEGKPILALVGGFGYKINFGYYKNWGLCIDGRFIYGINDGIHTHPHENPHYVNEKVQNMALVGTVGVMFKIVEY